MTATIRALILASLGAGIVLGLLFPVQRSAALTSYKVDVYPGGNGYLSCGWHVACISPYTSGDALDFGDPTWVYFRSKSQNSEGSSVAGTGRIAYWGPNQCTHWTYVDIYDVNGAYRAEVLYEHVESGYAGYSYVIYSTTGPTEATTEFYIGFTATEPVYPTCDTTAKHVHQQRTGGGMNKNTTNYPDVSTCNASCWLYKGNWTYWVFAKLWSY